MGLISISYFNGEINIPNTDKPAVKDLLQQFIDKYEPELLSRVMGVSFYNAFIAGLGEATVPQMWQDLLMGKGYSYYGRDYQWRGIVTGFGSVVQAIETLASIPITVGGGGAYDPVAGTTIVTLPPGVQGRAFKFFQRGFGELEAGVDYTVGGNTLALTTWQFANNDKYFYHPASLTVTEDIGLAARGSFIANYVYYWYMRNNSTATTDGGEKHVLAENAERSNPSLKISRAWNEAVDWIEEMRHYLNANTSTYTGWNANYTDCLRKINAFSI